MSLSLLLIESRNYLREYSTVFDTEALRNKSIQVTPNEQPSPKCGPIFLAIHGSSNRPKDGSSEGIWSAYAFTVSVTIRTADFPFDRLGLGAYKDSNIFAAQRLAIDTICDEVVSLLTRNNSILFNLNAPLQSDQQSLFIRYPHWVSTDASPRLVGPEHFHANASKGATETGLLMQVRFDGGERLQHTFNSFGIQRQ